MFLKAGALSLALLLASRVLGLLRETALAAAFGTSGQADVAVLMFTVPDLLAGLLVSGALAYVLLPYWGGEGAGDVSASQRRVGRALLAGGTVLGALLALFAAPAAGWLAGGLGPALLDKAAAGLRWSALALPAALLATLWSTRSQHERDFAGMYGANVVVNGVLIAAVCLIAWGLRGTDSAIAILGVSLVAAGLLRLLWLGWRHRGIVPAAQAEKAAKGSLPRGSLWVWAALSAGLPLALPFAARSIASGQGEGALATFNYAWKLVELPLLLAIQLVAALAFPAITRSIGQGGDGRDAARPAFALAWTLACAAVAALLAGAPAVARLLFGWGRMPPEALASIAEWGEAGAWGLLPQALTAIALAVLATHGRLRAAVWAYSAALAVLLGAAAAGLNDGRMLMWLLNAVFTLVATASVAALGRGWHSWLPGRAMLAALAAMLAVAGLKALLPGGFAALPTVAGLAVAGLAATFVIAAGYLASPGMRAALQR
jgi:putative peptidoglycan lipid II flippase